MQNDVGLGAGLHVGLDGRLAVELYGQVDDAPALHEAVGRGVGPAAGNVDAHGAAGPHYLVGGHAAAGCRSLRHGGGARGQGRRGPVGGCGPRQSLAQQGKGPLLLREAALAVAAVEAGQLGAEHGVVDAGHERCTDVDGRRFGHVVAGKLAGGVSQVELVEDAVLVVQGQPRPGFGPQPRALRREPAQVGPGRDLLGTHLGCLLETGTGLGRPVLAQHAGQQLPGGLHAFGHGAAAADQRIGGAAVFQLHKHAAGIHAGHGKPRPSLAGTHFCLGGCGQEQAGEDNDLLKLHMLSFLSNGVGLQGV